MVAQSFTTEHNVVTYLAPEECGPTVIQEDSNGNFTQIKNPVDVLHAVCIFHNVNVEVTTAICRQVANSILNQQYLYLHPPKEPSLTSSIIEWEQSLVEGHPTHPMHRTRLSFDPMPPILPSTNLMDTVINFVAVKRNHLTILGPFEDIMRQYLFKLGIDPLKLVDNHEFVVFPVHCLQIPNIFLHHRDHVRLLSLTAKVQAQSSLRTLDLTGYSQFCLKTSLAMAATSCLRILKPWHCQIGPTLLPFLDQIGFDKDRLIVAKEVASAFSNHPDVNVAQHLAAIFRDSTESLMEGRNEYAIPLCALLEVNEQGLARVCDVLKLETEDQKVAWFTDYARTFLVVFLPSVVRNGFALEVHTQNTLLRVGKDDTKLKGFIIRDMDGACYHQASVCRSTGLALGLGRFATDLKMVNIVAYHTFIHCHLSRLIRALDLHLNGEIGCRIVKEVLVDLSLKLPKDAPNYGLFDQWLHNPKSYLRCFVKTILEGRRYFQSFEESQSNILYFDD